MPFISRDWRSTGELWVKTEDGWEKSKVLECGKRKRLSNSNSVDNDEDYGDAIPPHCRIIVRSTREIAGFNGLSEAVRRLDFRSSVHDHRRFPYICALLHLLVDYKGNLSGSALRQLLQTVEEVASYVNNSQQNFNALRDFSLQLENLVYRESQKCWGKPLGSTNLWQEHMETIKRIQDAASHIEIKEPGPEIRPKLYELPEECIREIILRVADHRDLEAAANAWNIMASLVSEQRVWRGMVRFHFNQKQLNTILDKNKYKLMGEVKDWKQIYHQLRRTYGVKEDYAEVLTLCRYCRCLFWPSDGHPCEVDQSPDLKKRIEDSGSQLALMQPIAPAQFLKFFSL